MVGKLLLIRHRLFRAFSVDRLLHIVAADEAVYGKGAKQAVPDEKELADHLARKAKAISLLREKLLDELERRIDIERFTC